MRSDVRPVLRRPLLAVVLALGLVAAACSGGSGERASSAPTTVRIAAPRDPWPTEGTNTTSTHFNFPLNFNVYEPLVRLGPDFSLQPGLAERWEPLDNDKGWRFFLRPGVKFHDGRPFTADDVLWTWDRQEQAQQLTSVLNTLGPGSVRKIDDLTVDFVPAVANLRLPEQLAHPHGAILPKDKNFDSSPPVGTGPFRVVDYRPGESATFERFDGYWDAPAAMRRLEVRFITDAKARADALAAGEVDLALDVTPEAARGLVKNRRLRVVRSEPGRNQLLYVNRLGRAPFDLGADPVIRQAVSLAVDRAAYVREVFDSNAEPGRWMSPRALLGRAADLVAPPLSDPDRARRMLDEAGWKPGDDGIRVRGDRRLTLTMVGWAEVDAVSFDVVRNQLRQVGIEVVTKPAFDQPSFRITYGASEFDLDLEVPSQNDGNPAFLPISRMYSRYPSTERFAPGGAFDTKAEAALAARTLEDVRRAAAEMMQILVNDTNIVIPLAGVPRTYAMSRDFTLTDLHPSQANQRWTGLAATRK